MNNNECVIEKFRKIMYDDSIVRIKDATQRGGELTEAYPMGYPVLDKAMKGGVREGDLIIITGVSGMGKTTFAQNIGVNLSKGAFPSLWFSYEMLIDNLYAKFKDMGINEEEFLVYAPKRNTTGNIKWIKEKISDGLNKEATKFVFIDHIDFLTPININNSDQKRMVLKQITQELKTIAIEMKIIIFLIAHVKKVYGREIEMQDVAESSGIFQLADYVLAVNRNSIVRTDPLSKKKIEEMQNSSYIKILKNRMTGENAKMNFTLENNIIVPDDVLKELREEDIIKKNPFANDRCTWNPLEDNKLK